MDNLRQKRCRTSTRIQKSVSFRDARESEEEPVHIRGLGRSGKGRARVDGATNKTFSYEGTKAGGGAGFRARQVDATLEKSQVKLKAKILGFQEEAMRFMGRKEYSKAISSLLTTEKLCLNVFNENDLVPVHNKYLLLECYFLLGDYDRGLRQAETFTKRVFDLYKKRRLSREIANYLLHIHNLWGKMLMMRHRFSQASSTFYELLQLYERWRNADYKVAIERGGLINYARDEFVEDDLIMAKANLAEALMNNESLHDAVDRFEEVKRDIENAIVFEHNLLHVNVCN